MKESVGPIAHLIFVQKPISLILSIIAVLWIVVPFVLKRRGKNVIVNEVM